MCGIFGYFDRGSTPLAEDKLWAMGNRIRHRGPDDQGVFHIPGCGIGNQRLSIIDVAGGHQPFVSDDGQIAVVQNGEIYNYVELAHDLSNSPFACRSDSDTEVLLRMYERDGIEMVHQLNGMFAIAIWDGRSQTLHIVRDRIGVKPLHYCDDGTRLYFGSEIKSILAAGVRPEPDFEALHHFLSFNYVPPPFTTFKGIRHLMPGHRLEIRHDTGTVEEIEWWKIENTAPEDRSPEEWIEAFNTILEDAVRIRLRADVQFGAFLSGGVDSTSVVGLMAQQLPDPVQTFTIGFEDPRFDESMHAQAAAERFGTKHTCKIVDPNMLDLWPTMMYHCDQPHGDVSFMPTYRVSELAVQHVKMVLTGDGGDELFAGYDKYKDFFGRHGEQPLEGDTAKAYFESISLFQAESKQGLYGPAMRDFLNLDSANVIQKTLEESSEMDPVTQALHVDTKFLLPGNNMVKPDRMGMAVSLEAREPFLDVRMVELAFKIPGHLKLHQGETKYIYKKAVEELIGPDLAFRKKQMFTVPIGEWLKEKLASFSNDVLQDPRTQARGLFNQAMVNRMLSEHQTGKNNYTREIRALMAVEIWFRSCIDQEFDRAPSFEDIGFALG